MKWMILKITALQRSKQNESITTLPWIAGSLPWIFRFVPGISLALPWISRFVPGIYAFIPGTMKLIHGTEILIQRLKNTNLMFVFCRKASSSISFLNDNLF